MDIGARVNKFSAANFLAISFRPNCKQVYAMISFYEYILCITDDNGMLKKYLRYEKIYYSLGSARASKQIKKKSQQS